MTLKPSMAGDQQSSGFRFSIRQLLLIVVVVATFLGGRATQQNEVQRLKVEVDTAWSQAELLRENLKQERQSHQLSLLLTGSSEEDFPTAVLDIRTLDVSPNDDLLITGGTSGVKVWELSSSRLLRTLDGPQRAIRSVSVTTRGMIAAGGDDGAVFVWNKENSSPIHKLGISGTSVISLAFSPDGGKLAASSLKLHDGSSGGAFVRLWNPVTGEQLMDLALSGSYCRQLAFSPDGTLLGMVGHAQGRIASISVWDLKSNCAKWNVSVPQWNASSVAFAADGTWLATGGGVMLSADKGVRFVGEVKIWDSSSGQLLQTLKANGSGRVEAIAFSPDGAVVIAGASGPYIGVRVHKQSSALHAWEVSSGKLLWHQVEGSGSVVALDFSRDGGTLVVCDREALRLVDPRYGGAVAVVINAHQLSEEIKKASPTSVLPSSHLK